MTPSSPGTSALVARVAGLLRVRRFVRTPVWLYRAGLGFLFGSRLLMLEHTGRKTGARRYVVLEVVGRPGPGTYLVVSGFGARAQWFRNVRADPRVRVWLGSRRPVAATARLLDRDQATAVLAAYAAAHPRTWARVRPVLEDTLGARIGDDGAGLPVVVFDTGRAHLPGAGS